MITVIALFIFVVQNLFALACGMDLQQRKMGDDPFPVIGRLLLQIAMLVSAVYLWGIRNSVPAM